MPAAQQGRCKGTAGLTRKPAGRPRRVTRYRIRKGARRTAVVRGAGRHLVLAEKDQRRRKRHLVQRL